MEQSGCDIFIIGAPKAGTTSIFNHLAHHPDLSPSVPKETNFLVDPGTHMFDAARHVSNGWAGYEDFFGKRMPGGRRIEATPEYMYSKTALTELSKLPQSPVFIFILREPVSQLFSLYQYFKENWGWVPADMTFEDFVRSIDRPGPERPIFGGNTTAQNALEYANYSTWLKLWKDAVGAENMRVYLYEDFKNDPSTFIRTLCQDIDLDPTPLLDKDVGQDNRTYKVRNRRLQAINLKLRSMIPYGAFYRGLRSLYHWLNVERPKGFKAAMSPEQVAQLRLRYSDSRRILEQEFGLNLKDWDN